VGQAGADYGWGIREGFCAIASTTDCGPPPAGMTNPIYAYGHTDGCTSITAGAFVPNGIWPATYDGSYLFADYRCAKIWQLSASGSGFTATEFATDLGFGGPIMMTFGPAGESQALYYTTYAFGIGEVRRIDFTQQQEPNQPPTAALAADVTSGHAPLSVQFDGSGSMDPDADDTLTYIWDFGDGTTALETTSATISYTYSNAGTFTAALTVRDNHGASSTPAALEINVASALSLPENVGLPEVQGIPRVGNTLSATTGTWTGSEPLEFTYQWLRCAADGYPCIPITGATAATYTLGAADFGSSIRVAVTAVNAAGAALATSAATPRVKHECSGAPCT
jgi:PKD repeat protein